jgi:hypothetical protein
MLLVATRSPPYLRLLSPGALLLYLVATESSSLVPGGCDKWLLLMYLVATGNVSGGHTDPSYLRLLSPGGSTVVPGGYGVLPPLVPVGCDRWLLLMYLVATVNVFGGQVALLLYLVATESSSWSVRTVPWRACPGNGIKFRGENWP